MAGNIPIDNNFIFMMFSIINAVVHVKEIRPQSAGQYSRIFYDVFRQWAVVRGEDC